MNDKMLAEVESRVKAELAKQRREFASKGGTARMEALSPRRRKQIARKAAKARWGKVK